MPREQGRKNHRDAAHGGSKTNSVIGITFDASYLLPYLLASSGWMRSIVALIIRTVQRRIKGNVRLSVPNTLHDFTYEKLRLARSIEMLKQTGIVENVFPNHLQYSDEPFLYTAHVTPYGSGGDFFSEDLALWRALGENIERFLWFESDTFYRNRIRYLSHAQARRKDALDITSLAGFADEQRIQNERIGYTEDTSLGWIPARSLLNGRTILCPLQLVSNRYRMETKESEPMLRWSVTTGLATGDSLTEALLKGILEIIERDAFMISYLNRLSPPRINLDKLGKEDGEIAFVTSQFARYRIQPYTVLLPTDFPVHVVLTILVDMSNYGPRVCVGARASFDLRTSIMDSLKEALAVRLAVRSHYKKGFASTLGHIDRLRFWGQKKNADDLYFLLKGKKIMPEIRPPNGQKHVEQLARLVRHFKQKNYEACHVELTPKEVQGIGFRSVMVVAPQLQPLHLNESIPYLGGARLTSVPTELGYVPAKEINKIPHPFP